jgi:hypothetical protein
MWANITANNSGTQEAYLNTTPFAICTAKARLPMRPPCPSGLCVREIDIHKLAEGHSRAESYSLSAALDKTLNLAKC